MEPVDTTDSAVGSYEGMVDNLVTQFSSALDCFRELVQNSIDAGTHRIEVWMEYLPGEGHEGTIAIHVDDFGEGMDEAIIDNELTQLFASTKDDDLTKIGKFGIGFVSVFALQPRAVLIHTGRAGEYWEVLFHEDRSFSKTRVDNPVEGTQITIFLQGEYHRYQELTEQIPATLRHWCSHSTVEVTFEDRSNNDDFAPPEVINEDFEVDGECLQFVEHEGTEIALAYNEQPIYGFYNRGLTLALTDVGDDVLSRWRERFEFISFKIKSRYLEHTLARDSVIQDDQYERAMKLLQTAADGVLLDALVKELEKLASAESWEVAEYHRYGRLMSFLAREPLEAVLEHRERPILRCLNSGPMSITGAWQRLRDDGRLLLDHEATSLTKSLGSQGVPVLVGAASQQAYGVDGMRAVGSLLLNAFGYKAATTVKGMFWRAAGTLGNLVRRRENVPTQQRLRRALVAPGSVYYPITVDDEVDEALAPLLKDTTKLLNRADTGIARVTTGEVSGGVIAEAPFFVVAEEIAPLMARPPQGFLASGRRMEAVVNRNHPQFRVIADIYERDPGMAAYMLARGLSLSKDFMLDADQELLEASLPEIRDQFSR